MKTIYVVTLGCYSDYSINGLFSTPEKARAFIEKNKIDLCCGQRDIEEWELDELVKHTAKTVWFSKIDIDSGDIGSEKSYQKSCPPRYTTADTNSVHAWSTSSVSQEHARKLAVEKRQEVLRLQKASK